MLSKRWQTQTMRSTNEQQLEQQTWGHSRAAIRVPAIRVPHIRNSPSYSSGTLSWTPPCRIGASHPPRPILHSCNSRRAFPAYRRSRPGAGDSSFLPRLLRSSMPLRCAVRCGVRKIYCLTLSFFNTRVQYCTVPYIPDTVYQGTVQYGTRPGSGPG